MRPGEDTGRKGGGGGDALFLDLDGAVEIVSGARFFLLLLLSKVISLGTGSKERLLGSVLPKVISWGTGSWETLLLNIMMMMMLRRSDEKKKSLANQRKRKNRSKPMTESFSFQRGTSINRDDLDSQGKWQCTN